jgi:hypothetical protein
MEHVRRVDDASIATSFPVLRLILEITVRDANCSCEPRVHKGHKPMGVPSVARSIAVTVASQTQMECHRLKVDKRCHLGIGRNR